MWANAEVSACRRRSLDVSNAVLKNYAINECMGKFRLSFHANDRLLDVMHIPFANETKPASSVIIPFFFFGI